MNLRRLAGALLITGLVVSCAPAPPPRDSVMIGFRYSHFEPSVVRVPVGVPVSITLRNDDPIEHEWIIGGPDVHAAHRVGTEAHHGDVPTEVTVPAFDTRTTSITFDRPGEYQFICHLPGHEAYGMKGALRVG